MKCDRMSEGLQEQDEARIEVSAGWKGGSDRDGDAGGEFAEESLQSMKCGQSVVVNLDVNVNAGFLRLRFGDQSATNHRPSRITLAHSRLLTNNQTLFVQPDSSPPVSSCRGPTTFTSFHCHVGTFAAATGPCVIPAREQLSALTLVPIVIMVRLFDPKDARIVSVAAATVIALACGTNVRGHFPARSVD